jgi:hypothetical protein
VSYEIPKLLLDDVDADESCFFLSSTPKKHASFQAAQVVSHKNFDLLVFLSSRIWCVCVDCVNYLLGQELLGCLSS